MDTANRLPHATRRIIYYLAGLSILASNVGAEEIHPVWKYPPELPGAEVEVYKQVGDVKLRAWIFRPADWKSSDRRPAIVFYFGGGWRSGTPGQFYPQCRYLASRGMVAITVDYRVKNRHQVLASDCLADAKSAIRWVRQNARRLGVDPQRIVASGGSAGGHLAASVGMVPGFDDPADDTAISAVPNAMALYNPAVILGRVEGKQQLDEEKIKDIAARTGNKSRELSPFTHVKTGLPPCIIFHGTKDDAVPYWTVEAFQKAMSAKGNRCELKSYPNAPHGFFNTGRGGNAQRKDLDRQRSTSTTLQLDRFLQSLGYLKGPATVAATEHPNLHLRGKLQNSLLSFQGKSKAHVAFMGGSITQGEGYRPLVCEWLSKRFPETRFTFTNAGISSTCSTSGAFRLRRDVLEKGPVDLFFVEFAVNDDQDAKHASRECVRGMEGVVRQIRERQPMADVVMIHFVNPPIRNQYDAGKLPVSIAGHERVARHYQIPTVNLAKEVSDQIKRGDLTWATYGGTHPKRPGHELARAMIAELLSEGWATAKPDGAERQKHEVPSAPLDKNSYYRGHFFDGTVSLSGGWKRGIPKWKSIPGSFRSYFAQMPCYHNDQPGEEISFEFEGRAIGAYVLAGPDAGQLEFSIDGGPYQTAELFHRFSRGLHYPRTIVLSSDLEPGKHTVHIRLAKTRHKQSKGTAARILEFVVN